MFESRQRLAHEIGTLLAAIRDRGDARYACVIEPKGILFESPEIEGPPGTTIEEQDLASLRAMLRERAAALFGIPAALEADAPMDDIFEAWDKDEFLLAFVNGRVAMVVACPNAGPLRDDLLPLLRALTDRLLRFDESWRLDARGRGLFFGSPRLDVVVVGGSG